MFLLGDKSEIAVGLNYYTNIERRWWSAHLCYWIAGQQVGNFETFSTIVPTLESLKCLLNYNGKREDRKMFEIDGPLLFSTLKLALYSDDSEKMTQKATDENWDRFNITPKVEAFDGISIFLVESPPKAKILYGWHDIPDTHVVEATLKSGEFDSVIRETYLSVYKFFEDMNL